MLEEEPNTHSSSVSSQISSIMEPIVSMVSNRGASVVMSIPASAASPTGSRVLPAASVRLCIKDDYFRLVTKIKKDEKAVNKPF